MRKLGLLLPVFVVVSASAAETPVVSKAESVTTPEATAPAAQGISVDESNFKEIFNKSVAVQTETADRRARSFEVELAYQHVNYSQLELSNNYYRVEHRDSFKTMPSLQISSSWQILRAGGLRLAPYAASGYAYREEKLTANTSKTNVGIKDVVALHVVPVVAGFQVKHYLPWTRRFSVFLTPTVGAHWMYREGTLDGINQSYWIPFYGARAGLVLFESMRSASEGWFEGVTLGSSYKKSFANAQSFESWSADLGLRVML